MTHDNVSCGMTFWVLQIMLWNMDTSPVQWRPVKALRVRPDEPTLFPDGIGASYSVVGPLV